MLAAIASVIARTTIAVTGLYGVVRVHRMIGAFELRAFLADLRAIVGVAGPATLTSVATPIGYAYVTAAIAKYGDGAVAEIAFFHPDPGGNTCNTLTSAQPVPVVAGRTMLDTPVFMPAPMDDF